MSSLPLFKGTISTLRKSVHHALRAWNKPVGTPDDLLVALLLVRDAELSLQDSATSLMPRDATNYVLLENISYLNSRAPDQSEVLQRRFIEDEPSQAIANEMGLSLDQLNRVQRSGIEQLTDVIWFNEQKRRSDRMLELEAKLPPPTYKALFGVDAPRLALADVLLYNNDSNVVAIFGLGGIGKTALADSLIRHVIREFYFEDFFFVWVDPEWFEHENQSPSQVFDIITNALIAKILPIYGHASIHEQRVALRRYFKQKPILVFLDNIETNIDTTELFEHLNDWSGPSNFVVTTRRLPTKNVYSYKVEPLGFNDAKALLHYQARLSGQVNLISKIERYSKEIFEAVGGNPLALKLIVELYHYVSAEQILSDIVGGHGEKVDAMFGRIYRKTWSTITEDARSLLEVMPLLSSNGAGIDQLQAISGLSVGQMRAALDECLDRSLIFKHFSPEGSELYLIHKLTRTYINQEVNLM